MNTIKKGIVIHCSDSTFGRAILIDDWHRNRPKPFNNIGYNFVILNGQIENDKYFDILDGSIEGGRDLDISAAHARGYNDHIGICLIGIDSFTDKQFSSLAKLLRVLKDKYDNITNDNIFGHCDVSNKSCPNFDVKHFLRNYSI